MSHDKDKIDKIQISQDTREFIIDKLVEPYYKDMIKTTISGKKLWRNIGISLETASKVMVALGGIFSFSAGVYSNETLSFVSGSISCMSLALLQIASFSYKENKKQGDELNILLKKLNLDTIPSMPRSEDQSAMFQSREIAYRTPYRGSIVRQNSFPDRSIMRNQSPYPNNTQQHVTFVDTETQNHDIINISRHDLIELEEHIERQEEKIRNMNKELLISKNDIEKEQFML